MNRQYRRQMKQQEKLRQQRAERAAARRQKARDKLRARRPVRPAGPERPPFAFRRWLTRPYKSEDLLLLFGFLWLVRWATYRGFGLGAGPSTAAVTWALLITQAAALVATLAYLRWIAREGVEWTGPPGAALPAARLWGGAGAAGVLAYALGRGGELLATRIMNIPPAQNPLQVPAPVDWTGLAAGGTALAAVFALTFLVLTPVADEMFYRRLLGRLFLRTGMAERWAVLFTAFLYGLSAVGLIPAPRAAVVGVVLGFAYVRTGATGLVLVAHLITVLLTAFLG